MRPFAQNVSRPAVVTHSLWAVLGQTPWSLGLVGLLAYIFAIVSYKFPIGTASAIAAIVGSLLLLPLARVPRAFWLLGAFYLWAVVSSLASTWLPTSIDALIEYGKVILVVLAASVVLSSARTVLLSLGWFALCFVLFPIRGAMIGGDTIVGRLVWNFIYANPNDLAVLSLLAMGVTLALAQLKWRQFFVRPALYLFVVLEIWVILRTQSRGAALGLVAVAITALISAPAKIRRKFVIRGLIAAVVAFPLIPQATMDRYIGGTFSSEDVTMDRDQKIAFSSREERLMINRAAWKIAASNFVVGVGFGAFPNAMSAQNAEIGAKDAHNTYLNVLCETGLPGLLLLLAFLYLVGKEVVQALRLCKIARPDYFQSLLLFASSVGGFWVAALFGSYFKLVPPMIVMVLLVSYARMVKQASSTSI